MIKKPFTIVGTREIYHELGEFEIKAVLKEGFEAILTESKFNVLDSSGKQLKTSQRIWGNKVKCMFLIDENVSDGVAIANVSIVGKDNDVYSLTTYFWIIK